MANNVLLILLCHIISTTFVNARNVQDEETQELEKTKNELYKEILTAIDDGVETLKQINDSEVNIGLYHMQELKREIKEFNGSDGVFQKWIDRINKTQNTRRSPKKELILDVFDIANVFQNNKKTEKAKKKEKNTEDLKLRLAKWLADREREKNRIKEYKEKKKHFYSKLETCPNFGSKKDKTGRKKYPCCRKCCKKSYMGCL